MGRGTTCCVQVLLQWKLLVSGTHQKVQPCNLQYGMPGTYLGSYVPTFIRDPRDELDEI